MKRLLVALILALNAPMVAQDTRPDPLIEAAIYVTRLKQDFGCESGEYWGKKALATARGFRSASQTDRDTAGAFIAETTMLLEESRRRRKFLDGESLQITKLLQAGKVESARARISADNPPSCDGRFEQLLADVNARADQATKCEADGEEMLSRDRKAAKRLFEQAKHLDIELPGINQRIANVRASRGHRWSVGRVALYTVVFAAAGAGAYYGYEQYERSQRHPNGAP